MVFESFSWVGIGGSGVFYRARGECEMGFEPLIGKLMGSRDGDPRARDTAIGLLLQY
jgi:acetate kinase